jgi:hypothetical protein
MFVKASSCIKRRINVCRSARVLLKNIARLCLPTPNQLRVPTRKALNFHSTVKNLPRMTFSFGMKHTLASGLIAAVFALSTEKFLLPLFDISTSGKITLQNSLFLFVKRDS